MCTIVSIWVTFSGRSGICAKYENFGGGNAAERGTDTENGWVRSTHFSSVFRIVLDGSSDQPRQPVRPLIVGLSHIFVPPWQSPNLNNHRGNCKVGHRNQLRAIAGPWLNRPHGGVCSGSKANPGTLHDLGPLVSLKKTLRSPERASYGQQATCRRTS